MTVKELIQARIDHLKEEVTVLETHLAAGGTWLEQEEATVETWFKGVLDKIRFTPAPPVV